MNSQSLQRKPSSRMSAYLLVLLLTLGNFVPLFGHNPGGNSVSAPTGVATTINIDGTINEAVWPAAAVIDTLPNNCAEFAGAPAPPPVTLSALNDGVNLFMAFDIPDSSAQATDALFLVFDPNHNGGAQPEGGGTPDQALLLTLNNTAASNTAPNAQNFTGTGAGWSAAVAGLPAGWDAKYTRITAGTGKWQLELRRPSAGLAATIGFAALYLNETGPAAEDCTPFPGDGEIDDFYARFPNDLSIANPHITLPTNFPAPNAWANLNFGPPPPTVGFQGASCCSSPAITYVPNVQPFTPGVPVDIRATVHNFHASSVATNVNVEIRVHDFGTGGVVVSPFPLQTQVPSITASNDAVTNAVNWSGPPAGLHGCIRAEIKPPTTNQYFIQGGAATVQHNIDVAEMEVGTQEALNLMTFNPEKEQPLKIKLFTQVLMPAGFRGLTFELKQLDRELKAQEQVPVKLLVTAAADTPLTKVTAQKAQVPPTAGGAVRSHEGGGSEPVVITVKAGDRVHISATGEVDIDGRGPIPASGPAGQDVSKTMGEQGSFLLGGKSAARVGGALLGSFDNFASSFVIGSEGTVTVPSEVDQLKLAVNDVHGGFADNGGKGFEVAISTLPAFNVKAQAAGGAEAAAAGAPAPGAPEVTLPQVTITAASTSVVTVGQTSYNLSTNHGGATYQLLVVAGGHTDGGYLFGLSKTTCYALLLLLIIILILIIIWIRARKKHAI